MGTGAGPRCWSHPNPVKRCRSGSGSSTLIKTCVLIRIHKKNADLDFLLKRASILWCGIFYLELRHLPDGCSLLPHPAALRRPQYPVPEQRCQQRVTPVSGHRPRQLLPSSGICQVWGSVSMTFWCGSGSASIISVSSTHLWEKEGSGSGSIPPTNGSGSGRPKNLLLVAIGGNLIIKFQSKLGESTLISGHRSRQLLPSSGISHLQFWAGKTHVMMLTIGYFCW